MKAKACFVLFMTLATSLALGSGLYAGMKPLTGQFSITGKTPVDPAPNEARDTHLLMYLTGEAAQDLYEHMPVKPSPDLCSDSGALVKMIGDMSCERSTDEDYTCHFAINIADQKIEGGWAC